MNITLDFKEQTKSNIDNLTGILKEISEDELNKSYSAGSWSIGECIDHIIITDSIYLSNIRSRIEGTGFPDKKFEIRFIIKRIINLMEPPVKMKVKTFDMFKPEKVSGYSKSDLLNKYIILQNELYEILEHTEENKLSAKIYSPASKIIKLQIGESYYLMSAHDRRHIWQAGRIFEEYIKRCN